MTMDFSNKKIAILGAGIEGQSSAKFLKKRGAIITLLDEKEKPFPNLQSYDLIVRSPGVNPNHPALKSSSLSVTSSTNLFFELSPTKNIIGVTGTKGKGTTSTMIYEILKADGRDTYLGGNIGTAPLDFLDKLTADSWVVLELSSFQLVDIKYSPGIAVILMVTSEHLDWHADNEDYTTAKSGIVRYQTPKDYVVYNESYENSKKIAMRSKGIQLAFSRDHNPFRTGPVKISIPGLHNVENAHAAITVAQILHIHEKTIRNAIQAFRGLPHRLEKIRDLNGVAYYNDSFSTTPETTIAAIEAFENPKILILGGSSKNSDFSQLAKSIHDCKSLKAIIGIGVEWNRIKKTLQSTPKVEIVEGLSSMSAIVQQAQKLARPGDVVLLSPACASFDMFKNYKDRGEQFRSEVLKLS